MSHILFFDPFKEGHRVSHVQALISYLATLETVRTTFVVHADVIERVRRNFPQGAPPRVTFHPVADEVTNRFSSNNKDVFGGWFAVGLAQQLSRQYDCDQIYFMHLDSVLLGLYLRSLPILSPFVGKMRPMSGLLFRPTMHYETVFKNPLLSKDKLFNAVRGWVCRKLLSRSCFKLMTSLDLYGAKFLDPENRKVVGIPECVPDTIKERRKPDWLPQAWSERVHKFLLFGGIQARKGVLELLPMMEHLPPEIGAQCMFLVCGPVDEDVKAPIEATKLRLRQRDQAPAFAVEDRFVDDEELWWLIEHSTTILAPYRNHVGSSGILVWAAIAEKPVLGQSFGLMGYETRVNGLGLTVDASDQFAFCQAVSAMVTKGAEIVCIPEKRQRFAERNRAPAFAQSVFELLTK